MNRGLAREGRLDDGAIKWRIDGDLEGSAVPVVLCNGLMMSIPAWQPLVEPLSSQRAVVRFDFRGQLLSPARPHEELLGNVGDLVDLLDALSIPRAHLIGTSFGGLIALEAAARESSRVASVCAVTTASVPSPHLQSIAEGWRRGLVSNAPRVLQEFFHRMLLEIYSPAYGARHAPDLEKKAAILAATPAVWRHNTIKLMDAVESFAMGEELSGISCPAVVIAGGADEVTPPDACEALAARLPEARFQLVPGTGHALVMEEPERVVEIWHEFLESPGAGQLPAGADERG